MKIVAISNFDKDSVSDKLIAENVPPYYADCIRDALCAKYGSEHSTYWFVVKPDDYKLYEFDPR